MAYSAILDQITAKLSAVTAIGRVHGYLRWWRTDADFTAQMQATISNRKQIRAWLVTRDAVGNERWTTGGPHQVTHQFVIRGYLGVSDAISSEETFQALIDTVVTTLDNAITLGGNVRQSGPAQVSTIDHREFGQVVCHYCEIQFPVVEHLNRTYS